MATIVLSTGRCGTKSMSVYLGGQHEPDVGRQAIPEEFLKRAERPGYVEVSQYWRYHLDWLFAPEQAWIGKVHLVRNPFRVAESHFFRTVFYGKARYAYQNEQEPLLNRPDAVSRLDKICAYIAYWNDKFDAYRIPVVRLEDMRKRPNFPHKNTRWDRGGGTVDWTGTDGNAYAILKPLADRYGYTPEKEE